MRCKCGNELEGWSEFDFGFCEKCNRNRNDRGMKILKLQRLVELENEGTFGVLFEDERIPFCLTLEPEWKDNKTDISCIPKGEYICERFDSPKYGHTWQITNVPNREGILIHKGNIEAHTKGCVLLGESFGILNDKRAVLSSGDAFAEFTHILRDELQFKLIIV